MCCIHTEKGKSSFVVKVTQWEKYVWIRDLGETSCCGRSRSHWKYLYSTINIEFYKVINSFPHTTNLHQTTLKTNWQTPELSINEFNNQIEMKVSIFFFWHNVLKVTKWWKYMYVWIRYLDKSLFDLQTLSCGRPTTDNCPDENINTVPTT